MTWAPEFLLRQDDKEDKGMWDGIGSEIQQSTQSFEGKAPRNIWDRHQILSGGRKVYMEGNGTHGRVLISSQGSQLLKYPGPPEIRGDEVKLPTSRQCSWVPKTGVGVL